MAIASPDILSPNSEGFFRSSTMSAIVAGTVPSEATKVSYRFKYLNDATNTTPTFEGPFLDAAISFSKFSELEEVPSPWSFQPNLLGIQLEKGWSLYVEFYAINEGNGDVSFPSTVQIQFTNPVDFISSAPVPTGISVERANTYLRVGCAEVNMDGYDGDFLGYNFYVSLEEGGGTSGYSPLNDEYVTEPLKVKKYDTPLESSEGGSGGLVVKTSTIFRREVPQYTADLNAEALSRLTAAGLLPNQTYDKSTTFYFVATTSVYDPTLDTVVESPYSPEVSSRFITFSAVFNEIPVRNRDQIVVTLMQRIYGRNRYANQMASSVYKDLLDPISEEFSDYYIIQDFLSSAESIKGLIQFDDENGDGVSDPVETSTKKTRLRLALKLTNADAVQDLIDSYFEKKASNFNVERLEPTHSKGKVIYYAFDIPQEGLSIQDGSLVATGPGFGNSNSPVQYRVVGSRFIPFNSKEAFFNTLEQRYEIEADIIATTFGSLANVKAGAITHSVSGADTRFRVENTSPTTGGTDRENNLSLANRTQLAIAGTDSGTVGGYLLKALSVPGVRSARVEAAGDPLMRRDIDPNTGRHIGGKVDIYVQSEYLGEKQDIIAFSYAGPTGEGNEENFFVEDALNFRIRTNNSNVTSSTPIFELVKVFNVTRGENYDISGAVVGIGDGDTVQLNQNTTNLSIGMATLDVIEVDYRYRGSNIYVLDHQPVERVVSVTGDIDGTLPPESYELVKLEDPLKNGGSTIARDGVAINFFNGYPTESTRNVEGEPHIFLSTKPIKIARKGVDIDSIVVSSDEEGVDIYDKDVDFTIGKGGQADYTYLTLQPFSKIRSGSTVYVSYSHSQNLSIVYTVNEALSQVQREVEKSQHATADVVVKGAVQNEVDISLQVIRRKGYSETETVSNIRTRLGNYVNNLHVGHPLMLDDVISLVKNIEEVKTLVLPVTRMMKKNDSFIPQDYVGFADFRVFTENASKGVTSYLSVDPVLNYGTLDNGGPSNKFRAIYEGGKALVMAESMLEVSGALGRGYILSDGRILVSTTDGAPPQGKEYKVSYYTYVAPESEYASDITVGKIENLVVGSGSITIDASSEEA